MLHELLAILGYINGMFTHANKCFQSALAIQRWMVDLEDKTHLVTNNKV